LEYFSFKKRAETGKNENVNRWLLNFKRGLVDFTRLRAYNKPNETMEEMK